MRARGEQRKEVSTLFSPFHQHLLPFYYVRWHAGDLSVASCLNYDYFMAAMYIQVAPRLLSPVCLTAFSRLSRHCSVLSDDCLKLTSMLPGWYVYVMYVHPINVTHVSLLYPHAECHTKCLNHHRNSPFIPRRLLFPGHAWSAAAPVTLLLASAKAGSFITGTEMIVDGGFQAMSL